MRIFFLISFLIYSKLIFSSVFTYDLNGEKITNFKSTSSQIIVDYELLIKNVDNNKVLFVPILENAFIKVSLKEFFVFASDHKNYTIDSLGKKNEVLIENNMRSFKLHYDNSSIGALIIYDETILLFYNYEGTQFEISSHNGNYFVFDVNDFIYENSFTCAVEDKINNINNFNQPESSVSNPMCLEIAIEIDYYTRNTFSSNSATSNWASAIIAGVSQVYSSSINMELVISNTIIWQSTDPYASYINDASGMLLTLKNHWLTNNSSVNRDLVHLLTKRSNTGTGGIAYVDALCSNNWGYAFSSDLDNTTSFSFPSPPYTWNLNVVTHEIGHNIGANHTHWCGWLPDPTLGFSGGGIDDCGVISGSSSACNPPAPHPNYGTIMSYCHVGGGGIQINFHEIVKTQALIPGKNGASCLGICPYYGCTDPTATNYDPTATVDDGSCIYCVTGLPYAENFNQSIGTFTNTGSAGNWIRNSGPTPSNNTGPSNGASGISSDYYMYVEASSPNYPTVGTFILSSECFDVSATSSPQLSFSYHMFGSSVGQLNVYANGQIIWSKSGNQGFVWNQASLSLSNLLNNELIIEFEVYTGSGWSGDIAIDNVNILFPNIYGCTNPIALNYNPNANIDDGSCTFSNLIVSSSSTNPLCNGYSTGSINLTASGGLPPYTFAWSTGDSTQNISSLPAGLYTFTVSDFSGQVFTDSVNITQPSAINISYSTVSPTSSSNNGSITASASGGTPPLSYYWVSPYSTNNVLTNLSSGSYTLYVMDQNSCFSSININLIEECGDVTGIFSSNIIHDRAKIEWDDMNSDSCAVDQYRIKYRPVGTNQWFQKNIGSPIGSCMLPTFKNNKLLLNLSSSTQYEYTIKVWYCNGIISDWSSLKYFNTLDECPNVLNFQSSPINSTKVRFDWDSTGTYSFLRIKLRVDTAGANWLNAGGFGINFPILSKVKSGLQAGLSYRAQARTWCDPNGGPYRSQSWTPLIFWSQPSSAKEIKDVKIKQLVKVVDLLGREVNPSEVKNLTLLYIYDNGEVEIVHSIK